MKTTPKKSPFPGMDPYLEKYWGDIHHSLVQYARDQIQGQLPGALRARVEERIYLESDVAQTRTVVPDIRIIERPKDRQLAIPPSDEGGGVTVATPLARTIIRNEPVIEGYIEIRDGESGNRVITVIEVLSLANKAGGNGTREYRQKQLEVLSGDTSFVEIDLLRKGQRVFAAPIDIVPESHRKGYLACVTWGSRWGQCEIYGATLRERLPIIPIPLRDTDPHATLDLQSLIDQCYLLGRYDDTDYRRDLDPPLSDEDSTWADELLRKDGRR